MWNNKIIREEIKVDGAKNYKFKKFPFCQTLSFYE